MNQMTPGRMSPEKARPVRPGKRQGLEIAFDPEADPLEDLADAAASAPRRRAAAGEPGTDARQTPNLEHLDEGSESAAPGPAEPEVPAADPFAPPGAPAGRGADARETGRGGDAEGACGAPSGAARPGTRRADPAAAARLLGIPVPLAKIEVTVAVEVGRTRLTLADLVSIEPGELVALDRMADAPVDVLVNGKPFAKGEIVAIGDRFGVRLTELVDSGDLP